MKNNIFFLLLLLTMMTIMVLLVLARRRRSPPEVQTRRLWTYWDTPSDQSQPPGYISLCLIIMKRRYPEIVILNKHNVSQYLSDLPSLESLPLCQQVDVIRVWILQKYGGLYLDADTLLWRDLDPIFEALDHHEFVGLGCSKMICARSGFPRPSNGAMASRPSGKIITALKRELMNRLQQPGPYPYFYLGKWALWKVLDKGYPYRHLPAAVDGSRDAQGHWIATPQFLSRAETQFLDESQLLMVFLANNVMSKTPYASLTPEEILTGPDPTWLSRLFRRAWEKLVDKA